MNKYSKMRDTDYIFISYGLFGCSFKKTGIDNHSLLHLNLDGPKWMYPNTTALEFFKKQNTIAIFIANVIYRVGQYKKKLIFKENVRYPV